MEAKEKFKVIYSPIAMEFLQRLEARARDKIIYNVRKASYVIDPKNTSKGNCKS